MNIQEKEIQMWEAAKQRDPEAFLQIVDENAVMVCGGYRCSGLEYAQIIREFDVAHYQITGFEVPVETEQICQVHYVITTKVADPQNQDLEGTFHITSTWKQTEGIWKLVFNMDSRIFA